MINTIIFDLSEVYLNGLLGFEKHIQQDYPVSLRDTLGQSSLLKELFHGEISEEEFWQKLISSHNLNITVQQFKSAIRKNFTEINGTRDIIESLKDKGYKLGLLSVHAKEWIEYCEYQFDYHKLFDSRVYSFEVAVSKPDKRAFEIILEKLEVQPLECLFIDDSKRNLQTAKEIGMNTLLFRDPKKLKKDLQALSIRL